MVWLDFEHNHTRFEERTACSLTQQEAERLFAEVHRLDSMGKSRHEIAEALGLRRATVIKWLRSAQYSDQRGWKAGRARTHADATVAERICQIKRRRIAEAYLWGSEYVQMEYRKTYPADLCPSIWQIDEAVRKAGLQTRSPKKRQRGGSQYLLYPVESMRRLGLIQQSADFIGKKFLTGSSHPVTIFSTCYYRPFKMYHIQRTEAEKASFAMEVLLKLWTQYPMPHVFRMDNGGTFRGTGHSVRRLGTFIVFLLNLDLVPLFGSPSKPWTNPAVEGHNRVFTEKVWHRHRFNTLEEIDRENERFNREGQEFFQFRYHDLARRYRGRCLVASRRIDIGRLHTRRNKSIHFIRFVGSSPDEPRAHITVMNERIFLDDAFSNQFVFATWNLEIEQLLVVSEYQGTCTSILRVPFKINL